MTRLEYEISQRVRKHNRERRKNSIIRFIIQTLSFLFIIVGVALDILMGTIVDSISLATFFSCGLIGIALVALGLLLYKLSEVIK